MYKRQFQFNNEYYLQKSGAAMGHAYCVHCANIFLANWEMTALRNYPIKPFLWFRFIDDIIMVWVHSKESFMQIFDYLNNLTPSIKLTYEFDYHSIDFLDVTIFKGPRYFDCNIFDTKVFFKPTDRHQLLHMSSYHPGHTFKSVVKSQVLRFSRICNNQSDFDDATSILFQSLYKRGYSRRMLRSIKSDINSRQDKTLR